MNKKDYITIIILITMVPLWLFIDRNVLAPKFPVPVRVPIEQTQEPATTDIETESTTKPVGLAKTELSVANAIVEPPLEEKTAFLDNGKIQLEITSIGGGIKSATLLEYPELNQPDSEPVIISFSNAVALAYEGVEGIGSSDAFELISSGDGKSIVLSKTLADLTFVRTIILDDAYLLRVEDHFAATADTAYNMPALRIRTGYMENPKGISSMRGASILGADSHSPTDGVSYWGRKLSGFYGKGESMPLTIDVTPEEMTGTAVDWVSAKNKFFTQVLFPDKPTATMSILSERTPAGKRATPINVAATLTFSPFTLAAGESVELGYSYYIGPKKYAELKAVGNHMEKVMEFETTGMWSFMNWLMEPARKSLLALMNWFYAIIPSYGVAIILLTLLVRILFWPLTHKSTEKMRINSEKMQIIQPKIKELQERYKAKPAKLREETAKLYQEHNFNPMGMMGGCLPMFVQIPIFIALFTVLRNAIELRYAGFLWIADLSAPENLFMGKLPFIGALNILPIVMAVSMVWQQKLSTPTNAAATPEQKQQQQMMTVMMPIMMLVMFYGMPSGLVLYWTTSNLLMILQTVLRNLSKKKAEA